MAEETRSLWEQFDSDVEPWKRGRSYLIWIGIFQFFTQGLVIAAAALTGNFERAAGMAIASVLFWLLFYFVWIGKHWFRWLWGAWNLINGFCLLIWAWRDSSASETVSGALTFAIGFVLCFSSSIYFFACRQRESIRWRESVVVAVVCAILLLGVLTTLLGLVSLREQWRRDATTFGLEGFHRTYHDYDYDWVYAHATPQQHGEERLKYFFSRNRVQVGPVGALSDPVTRIDLRIGSGLHLVAQARLDCETTSVGGPLLLHETLVNQGEEWQIEHMWWDYLPVEPVHVPGQTSSSTSPFSTAH